jgi:hypothetical protein
MFEMFACSLSIIKIMISYDRFMINISFRSIDHVFHIWNKQIKSKYFDLRLVIKIILIIQPNKNYQFWYMILTLTWKSKEVKKSNIFNLSNIDYAQILAFIKKYYLFENIIQKCLLFELE